MSPELAHTIAEIVLVLVTGYVGWSQRRNRKVGGKRDATMDALAAEVRESGKGTESALKEFGGQLAVINQTGWALKARVDVHDTRLDHVEREVERLREKP